MVKFSSLGRFLFISSTSHEKSNSGKIRETAWTRACRKKGENIGYGTKWPLLIGMNICAFKLDILTHYVSSFYGLKVYFGGVNVVKVVVVVEVTEPYLHALHIHLWMSLYWWVLYLDCHLPTILKSCSMHLGKGRSSQWMRLKFHKQILWLVGWGEKGYKKHWRYVAVVAWELMYEDVSA